MPITRLTPQYCFTEDRLEQLKQVVPEAFADGLINWETLREILGDHLEDEDQQAERFGLFWPGKRVARRAAAMPPQGALRPAPGEGVNEGSTRHIFIEGENLEVLKLLRKAYAGRVKMIYIDPPYNTGKDFVYRDDYAEPVEAYLRRSGQMGEGGELLTTNPKTGGRYHSNWLNMMYPRLVLARELLREDGVIFVSIDDNEVHNLRQVMGEVFGQENFIACMPWKGRGGRQASTFLAEIHEYVLVFACSSNDLLIGSMQKERGVYAKFDTVKQRKYRTQLLRKWGNAARRIDRPNLWFGIPAPDGTLAYPRLPDGTDGRWRWGRKAIEIALANNDLEFAQTAEGWTVYEKQYEPTSEEETTKRFPTWLDDVGTTANGTQELQALFGQSPFDYPKPSTLLRRLLQITGGGPEDDQIVLDFLAGSCTTAQAVLDLNREEDGGNRHFIMVQLPEKTAPHSVAREAGFGTIAEIGKGRISRGITRPQQARAG
ncbi:MAG: site-specific DNA-methyltransferase, partial [Chloroflexi bacterium]|nr:site-specific DNA-methyltransferase [Chloroflexota bacterium]